MIFDNQAQKDFVVQALAKTPITTTLGRIRSDAEAVGPILMQVAAGEIAKPKTEPKPAVGPRRKASAQNTTSKT